MKFGVFLPSATNGFIMSRNSPQFAPSFQHNLEISMEAERLGLDFVLAMMKYRGFPGDTPYWEACLESLTLISAIGASTKRIEVIPTAAILSIHPAVMARMVATIDDVTGGRCALNIVSGWNKPEYGQMGMWPGDEYFQDRYSYAAEYTEVLKLLWEQGRATFDGKFFKLNDCTVLPKPSRQIPLVCAGSSPKGLEFTAKYGDYSFVGGQTEKVASIVKQIKSMGAENGRSVGCYAGFQMIIADTDAEAQRIYDDIEAGSDLEALAKMIGSSSMDTNVGGSAQEIAAYGRAAIEKGKLSAMAPMIIGSPETVASKIEDIVAETGIDGMLLSWPDFVPGIRAFGEKVLPKLRLPVAA